MLNEYRRRRVEPFSDEAGFAWACYTHWRNSSGSRPGGRVALYFIAKEEVVKYKLVTQTGLYQLYTGEELVELLQRTGFQHARFVTKSERFRTGVCALGEK